MPGRAAHPTLKASQRIFTAMGPQHCSQIETMGTGERGAGPYRLQSLAPPIAADGQSPAGLDCLAESLNVVHYGKLWRERNENKPSRIATR